MTVNGKLSRQGSALLVMAIAWSSILATLQGLVIDNFGNKYHIWVQ